MILSEADHHWFVLPFWSVLCSGMDLPFFKSKFLIHIPITILNNHKGISGDIPIAHSVPLKA